MSNNQYYYWSNTTTNKDGENLETCLEKYGTGVQKLNGNRFIMECIFLDESRSFGNSWCLRCYNAKTKVNVVMKMYEENPDEKVFGIPKLNPINTNNKSK